jgi:nucleoside-diphosphate-sugar epimerase
MAKVLVTGGAGFIGSNLTEGLLKEHHTVRVLDNFSTGRRENLMLPDTYGGLEILEGDIRDLSICRKAVEGVEYVFHEAAIPSVQRSVEDPLSSHSSNANGTLNVLIAARDAGVKRWIFASSSSVYGDAPSLPKREESPLQPLSPYALHKRIGEEYGRLFYQLYGLETVSLRYFNIFGPKQDPSSVYSGVISRFIDALQERDRPVVFGDGEQSRDFTYVENVVQANIAAMKARHFEGEVINIACGQSTSLNQLLDILRRLLGADLPAVYEEPRKGDVRHSLADIERARRMLNYDPRVGIEIGLEKTIGYFKTKTGQSKR